ncbi:hypothetical protein DPMN_027006 [Dreissena polymorpha]|uniref:Uncharacterized protein n=1 Tax=Dreissena polymorpha TaxID=45954 RepID=A0A9D4LW84_DREPO|nr:hypothetical protein DPMN_027006 [Dreissena polymorpha]
MAQNAHASPVTNLSGQSQASQSSQFYGSPQLTQMPYSYMLNTPNFYGQGFIPPGTPSLLPSSDILSSILERLFCGQKVITVGPNTTNSVGHSLEN